MFQGDHFDVWLLPRGHFSLGVSVDHVGPRFPWIVLYLLKCAVGFGDRRIL